jgi:DNA-binding transcriptional LysR family regulator
MLPKIDLNALMLFQEVVSAGSITRACANTGISKSTISRKLAQLETEIGSLILKKNSRTLAVTGIGHTLYEYGRRIAADAVKAGLETTEMQSKLGGTLRVSMPSDFGVAWLGRAVAAFAVHHPDIRLEIGLNSGIVDLFKEPYDIAIHLGTPPPSRLVYRRLATLARGIYASPGYLEKQGLPLTLEDLRRHHCVVTEQQRSEGNWTFRNASRRRHVEVSGHAIVNNIALVRELLIGGVGLGLLTHALCRGDLAANRLVRVLPTWESAPLQATALILSRDRIPRKTRAFLDFIALWLDEYEGGTKCTGS